MTPRPDLTLRYMSLEDIPQVVQIDRVAFSTPWSARSYAYEVGEATHSHMVVLEQRSPVTFPPPRPNGWLRLWKRFSNGGSRPTSTSQVVAYGGLWRILDEAHVSTIATHPDFRGKGYGEIALVGMMRRALTLGAEYVVLEVRVTNTIAQNLYQKHGFRVFAVKNKYYRDNGEDAYDMRLEFTRAIRSQLEANYRELLKRHAFADLYTEKKHNP